jgi:hypothetical protein
MTAPLQHGLPVALAMALLAAAMRGQEAAADPITEPRVKEVVSFLASDDLLGRDSPSPGQDKAAEYIAAAFKRAGLTTASEAGGFFHQFTLQGVRLDSDSVELKVRHVDDKPEEGDKIDQERELKANADVRLWRAGDGAGEPGQTATVGAFTDPRIGRLLMGGGRRPVLLEIDPEDPSWQKTEGLHQKLGQVRQESSPVFLVRKGALPAGALDSGTWTVTWKAKPAEAVAVKLRNVVGILKGKELPDEYVIVSAHYDHIGTGAPVNGDSIYNGADDDASGTTAVVTIAEALAKAPPPRRSIAFVCFSAEEKGLRGSQAFAQEPPFPLAQVVANVNIEMIGRPPGGGQKKAWITGSEYSDFAAIARPALARAGIELTDFDMATMLFAQSDNYSLAAKGVVAHSISAGSLHHDYHQPSDEVSKLDLPHMTAVIRGLREMVLEFANRAAAPAWNEAGRNRLKSSRR